MGFPLDCKASHVLLQNYIMPHARYLMKQSGENHRLKLAIREQGNQWELFLPWKGIPENGSIVYSRAKPLYWKKFLKLSPNAVEVQEVFCCSGPCWEVYGFGREHSCDDLSALDSGG